MSLELLHTGLKTLFTTDIDLTAWVRVMLGKEFTVLDGNIKVEQIKQRELPALILEPQPADVSPLGIGSGRSQIDGGMGWAVVWSEQDRARAMTQKLQLPDTLIKAVMNNNTLDGTVSAVWIDSYEPDGGGTHPVHVMRGTAAAQYRITGG